MKRHQPSGQFEHLAKRMCPSVGNDPWELPSEDSARIARIQQHATRTAEACLDICGSTGMLERLSQISEELRTGIAYLEACLDAGGDLTDGACLTHEQCKSIVDYIAHKLRLLQHYAKCAVDQFELGRETLPPDCALELETSVGSLRKLCSSEQSGQAWRFGDRLLDALVQALNEDERSKRQLLHDLVGEVVDELVAAQHTVREVFAACSSHVGRLLMSDFLS